MYVVSATAPTDLAAVDLGWEYADGYFPRKVKTLKDARSIAKLAKAKGGTDIQITKEGEETQPVEIEEPSFPGVALEFNQAYVAGLTIKKYGFASGITDEMVYYCAEGFADSDREATARKVLTAAWHAIRAFAGEVISPIPLKWLIENEIKSEADWWRETEEYVKERLAEVAKEAEAIANTETF
ncbi:MAG: hypothetical protein IT426_20195 [Pirellulales bacterium]|nr:hypothetical protein [Pirellulales bacterium]